MGVGFVTYLDFDYLLFVVLLLAAVAYLLKMWSES